MKISIIVAASTNNVIGNSGGLPWRLPEDLKRFKQITMGKPMIMGRATWDSIGRPLPGRQNIIVTRQSGFAAEGCDVANSPDQALEMAGDVAEVMIIGGGKIYDQFLTRTDRIYLTRINAEIEGDTFFPALNRADWKEIEREEYPASPEREHAFAIITLEKCQFIH